MKVRRKPRPPVHGCPAGVVGPYERKKATSAVGWTFVGMVIMGAKLIAQFANPANVGDMLTNGTYTGGVGLVIVGLAVILKNRFTNNVGKKL